MSSSTLNQLEDKLKNKILEILLYGGEGKVCLIDIMPRLLPEDRSVESRIAQVAGVCYDSTNKTEKASQNLVNYLLAHGHNTPVENIVFTLYAEMPGFVRDHLVRHRTFTFDILSLRYTTAELEKYYKLTQHPKSIRGQSNVNKQSGDQDLSVSQTEKILSICKKIENNISENFKLYEELINLGLAREVARTYLPVGIYTKLFFTVDLHNLMHFLHRRTAPDAQAETRELANGIMSIVEQICPQAMQNVRLRLEPKFTVEEVRSIKNNNFKIYESKSAQKDFEERLEKLK